MPDKKQILFALPFSGIIIFIFYYFHFKYTTNIPIYDDYDAVIYFLSSFIDTPTLLGKIMWLIAQHREHRYLFPRIFLLFYHFIFGEINFKVIIFIGHIALLGIYLLIIKTIVLRNCIRDNLNCTWIIVSVTLLFFNFQYWGGSTWAIASFFFYFGMLFSFISIYLLTKNNRKSFVWSLLFAILAAGTSGNGLLVFIIGAALLYSRKKLSKELLYWLAVTAVVFLLYFLRFESPPDQTPLSVVLLEKPFKLILFYLSYLGSVFKQVPKFGNALSIISGIIFIVLFIFLVLKKYYRSNPAIFGFILFLFLTMFTSSLARVDVGFIPRYIIFSTLLIICFSLSILEIFSRKIKPIHLFIFLMLSLVFNIYSFIYNIGDMKKNNEILTEGAILAKAGDFSLLVYTDSSSVKKLLQSGVNKNIYKLPDFHFEDFLSREIDISSKHLTGDITNTFNNFANTSEHIYINGWVTSNDKSYNNNSKIYLVLKSDRNVFAVNTTTMRRKELKEKNKQSVTDNTSYSLALLKKQMNIPAGIYDLGFYSEMGNGKYGFIFTDEKIVF